MLVLGIDPSLRHTGLCLWDGSSPSFYESKTGDLDVLSASRQTRADMQAWLGRHPKPDLICLERQLSVGAQSSAMMYHTQLNVMEVLKKLYDPKELVFPLPNQLQSYLRKKGLTSKKASDTVAFFKEETGYSKRVSIHCVDAFYLCELAIAVKEGRFSYNLPSKETPIMPWRILNGK